jgi:sugar lactone lactonase YvrE
MLSVKTLRYFLFSILILMVLAGSTTKFINAADQISAIKILGPDNDPNPVVNQDGQIQLIAVDEDGKALTGVTFGSGSPDVAQVDQNTGLVRGIERGFATVTARRGSDTTSVFVAVAKVESGSGMRISGDTKTDTSGRIYISDPTGNVILRKDGLLNETALYAGSRGMNGRRDGRRAEALFAGPTAVTIDNSASGGIYVADTLNHSIRKIDAQEIVTTVIGTGSPGINTSDVTPFDRAAFNSPRGVAADIGGNLFIADTDNHAIYIADFARKEVRLLAGRPGVSGKADGRGREALFRRPTGIVVSQDGRSLRVADTGNNRVRLITRDGVVTTIGRAGGGRSLTASNISSADQTAEEIEFPEPQSVSFDGTGNLYVVDRMGVRVATRSNDQTPQLVSQVVSLAQAGSFGKAASVVVRGTEAIVLDNNASNDAQAVKVVTLGAPRIESISKESVRLEGGEEVVITGKNFAPETRLVLGDSTVLDFTVESATTIRFTAPRQIIPGGRTLTVQTRGGVDQRKLGVLPKPFSELADGEITTVAGGVSYVGDGSLATSSMVALVPDNIVIDAAGNLFIADTRDNRIRRVDANTGIINTFAGNGRFGFSGDGGQATSAGLSFPRDIAIDSAGNLFIADSFNLRIRRVDATTGIITTVAGNGLSLFSGDGGQAIDAGLFPIELAIDNADNLFFVNAGDVFVGAGTDNGRIRRVDARTGIITTVAGNGSQSGGDGGPATSAGFVPNSLDIDNAGNIFIADVGSRRIRRVDAVTGIITTFAGNGKFPFSGDGGPAINAGINPFDLTVDSAGNLFIADFINSRIRRVDASTGIITTVAGRDGGIIFGGDGRPPNGFNAVAPTAIAVDISGNLFIADSSFVSRVLRADASTGTITNFAGNGVRTFVSDGGPATSAGLTPAGVAIDASENLFIGDVQNNLVRKVDATTGIITTVAGNGDDINSDDDGVPATKTALSFPSDIIIDASGNLFIADSDRVRRVDARTGIMDTVAGTGIIKFSGDGGPAKVAQTNPVGIAFDKKGNLLIADNFNSRIRRVVARTGIINTVAGNGNRQFSGDGGPAKNAGLRPDAVAIDAANNLLITDFTNSRIRRVDARTKIINTVAGNGNREFSGDGGPATRAGLDPIGLAIDRAGNLFIADFQNGRIRRVDAATGIITTVAGNGIPEFSGDGGRAIDAGFLPLDVTIDSKGNLFISDLSGNAVRVIKGIAR